jgi:outer membrane receptor protein involved in Fe transport
MKRCYNKLNIASFLAVLFFSCTIAFAQGTISGKVTDVNGDAVIGANVFLSGTTMGAATDLNGNYTIPNVPEGDYTVKASAVGYKAEESSVTVADGLIATLNFTLEDDILNLSEVVVTGTQNPKTKLQSSVAITTLDAKGIEEKAPRNTADLLKAVPGFYVESSGGEGGNNLFARGIPADGSFRYVSMQEDGMPVFASPEMMFMNIDLLMRVDNSVSRMEGVRGGSGSIYASNAAGGIINFITRTGGPVFQGSAKFGVGDYGAFRTDLEFGGPISDKLRYHVGGFYRSDDGIRAPGFKANDGGQIRANLIYLMDNGHVRINAKFMREKNIFYLPIPLQGLDEELPGFDANYGTMTSTDFNYLNVRKPEGRGFQEETLDKGMHPQYFSFGGELLLDLGQDWILKNNFKKSIIDHQFNAIFSLNDPTTAVAYAMARGDTLANGDYAGNYAFSYARGVNAGDTINNIGSLNGNGLVTEVGWWAVTMPVNDFINDLRISKYAKTGALGHNLTLGYFFSYDNQRATWWWHNVLSEIKSQPRALNLKDDMGVYFTHEGYTRYGATYLNYQLTNSVNAIYFNDEIDIDQFTLDLGIRWEKGDMFGWSENTEDYDMGDPTTRADDQVTYGNGVYEPWEFEYDEFAWSVGANYAFSPNFAIFGRASNGYRAPDDNNLVFDRAADPRVEDISQYELGAKYSSPSLAFFATGFYSLLNDFPFSDERLGPTGEIISETRFADSFTLGLELEIIYKYRGLLLNLLGTFQNPTYTNYKYDQVVVEGTDTTIVPLNFDDNQVRRIPKIYFTFTASYVYRGFYIGAALQYFGDRFTDDANTDDAKLPAFAQLNAGISYTWDYVTFAIDGTNLTNVIGLTEGNPRTESLVAGAKPFRMARPIMGRSFIFSVGVAL